MGTVLSDSPQRYNISFKRKKIFRQESGSMRTVPNFLGKWIIESSTKSLARARTSSLKQRDSPLVSLTQSFILTFPLIFGE